MKIEERVQLILKAVHDLPLHDWAKIKRSVDICYQSEAAKVQLSDSERLKKILHNELTL